MRRLLFAFALLAGAAAWSWFLAAMARQSSHTPAAHVSLPDLDELEARLVRAMEITRRWEWLRERSEGAEEVACDQLAEHVTYALPQEVR